MGISAVEGVRTSSVNPEAVKQRLENAKSQSMVLENAKRQLIQTQGGQNGSRDGQLLLMKEEQQALNQPDVKVTRPTKEQLVIMKELKESQNRNGKIKKLTNVQRAAIKAYQEMQKAIQEKKKQDMLRLSAQIVEVLNGVRQPWQQRLRAMGGSKSETEVMNGLQRNQRQVETVATAVASLQNQWNELSTKLNQQSSGDAGPRRSVEVAEGIERLAVSLIDEREQDAHVSVQRSMKEKSDQLEADDFDQMMLEAKAICATAQQRLQEARNEVIGIQGNDPVAIANRDRLGIDIGNLESIINAKTKVDEAFAMYAEHKPIVDQLKKNVEQAADKVEKTRKSLVAIQLREMNTSDGTKKEMLKNSVQTTKATLDAACQELKESKIKRIGVEELKLQAEQTLTSDLATMWD
jgi:hypothetical protein